MENFELETFKKKMIKKLKQQSSDRLYKNKTLDELIELKRFYQNNIKKLEKMDKSEYYKLLNHSDYYDFRENWDDYSYTPKQIYNRVLKNNIESLDEIRNYMKTGTTKTL